MLRGDSEHVGAHLNFFLCILKVGTCMGQTLRAVKVRANRMPSPTMMTPLKHVPVPSEYALYTTSESPMDFEACALTQRIL